MKKTYGLVVFFLLLFLILIIIGLKQGFFQIPKQFDNLNQSSPSGYNPAHYTPSDLKQLLIKDKEKYVVIDTRTKQEYDKGHVPGSLHSDYYDSQALKKAADKKIPITYDAFSSMRGIYAAYVLYQAGYKEVGILLGGLSAWAEDIGELESSQPGAKSVFMHPKNIFPKRKRGNYPPGQGEVEFTIQARRFAFTPNKIEVKHGQTVILHVKSIDVIHGFALPEFKIEEELLPNVQVDISFVAERKGNFPFVTNIVSGSRYSSMVGNVIVE